MLKKGLIVGVLLLGLGWLATRPAPHVLAAGPYIVNSYLDEPDDNTSDGACHSTANHCTLRAAVMEANHVLGAGASIILPAGTFTLTQLPIGPNGDSTGDLNLTTPPSGNPVISLLGQGAATTIIDAAHIDRVFNIDAGRSVVMSGITVRNGLVGGSSGGGILTYGTLTVTESSIVDNSAMAGGGVYNSSIMWLIQSTVASNFGKAGGGVYSGLTLYVDRSTFAFNKGLNAGGLTNAGTLYAENSTFTQNEADGNGGGIYNYDTAYLYNVTFAFNGADADFDHNGGIGGTGAGVFNLSGDVYLRNTLMAGNYLANSPVYNDCGGTMRLFGPNMTWTANGCTFNTTNGTRLQLNSLNTLGSLQNNGGPTRTNALLGGSNAIDNGQACVGPTSQPLPTDQRGADRIIGPSCDLGAYEYRPPLALPLILR
jgi:CSLREA domain-containing protein